MSSFVGPVHRADAVYSIFVWELFPEWIFPLTTGFSIFCLANPNSSDFTRVFGGSNGNEGLGLLSFCFDWQYISRGDSLMVIPLRAQVNRAFQLLLVVANWLADT